MSTSETSKFTLIQKYITIALFGVLFIYYIINNIYFIRSKDFVNKPFGLLRFFAIVFLFLFYVIFITMIVILINNMLQLYIYYPT